MTRKKLCISLLVLLSAQILAKPKQETAVSDRESEGSSHGAFSPKVKRQVGKMAINYPVGHSYGPPLPHPIIERSRPMPLGAQPSMLYRKNSFVEKEHHTKQQRDLAPAEHFPFDGQTGGGNDNSAPIDNGSPMIQMEKNQPGNEEMQGAAFNGFPVAFNEYPAAASVPQVQGEPEPAPQRSELRVKKSPSLSSGPSSYRGDTEGRRQDKRQMKADDYYKPSGRDTVKQWPRYKENQVADMEGPPFADMEQVDVVQRQVLKEPPAMEVDGGGAQGSPAFDYPLESAPVDMESQGYRQDRSYANYPAGLPGVAFSGQEMGNNARAPPEGAQSDTEAQGYRQEGSFSDYMPPGALQAPSIKRNNARVSQEGAPLDGEPQGYRNFPDYQPPAPVQDKRNNARALPEGAPLDSEPQGYHQDRAFPDYGSPAQDGNNKRGNVRALPDVLEPSGGGMKFMDDARPPEVVTPISYHRNGMARSLDNGRSAVGAQGEPNYYDPADSAGGPGGQHFAPVESKRSEPEQEFGDYLRPGGEEALQQMGYSRNNPSRMQDGTGRGKRWKRQAVDSDYDGEEEEEDGDSEESIAEPSGHGKREAPDEDDDEMNDKEDSQSQPKREIADKEEDTAKEAEMPKRSHVQPRREVEEEDGQERQDEGALMRRKRQVPEKEEEKKRAEDYPEEEALIRHLRQTLGEEEEEVEADGSATTSLDSHLRARQNDPFVRVRHDITRLCLPDISPDDYFCPRNPNFLSNKTEVIYTAKDTQRMYWNGIGLVFAPNQVGDERQCLMLNIQGDVFATIYGWKVKGLKLPKPLQEKYKIRGGMIKTYTVKFLVSQSQWQYLMDGSLPKVFVTDGDINSPDIETRETLHSPINVAAIQFCPISSEGETPLIHVDLFGCRLYPKNEFALLYFDMRYEEPYTCVSSMDWMGEDLVYESNAGHTPDTASFSSGGFSFTGLPDELPGGPNSDMYLQARMTRPSILFRLKIGGSVFGMSQGLVSAFTVAYQDVANVWRSVVNEDGKAKIFDTGLEHAPTAASRAVVLAFPHPIVTKAIRLYPQTWWGHGKVIRLDVEGCNIFPIHDRSPECRVPYNLISRPMLNDQTTETLLSEEGAIIDSPNGFDFQLSKADRWQNRESFIRATFPEPAPRRVTSLVLRGGHTAEGRTGFITDLRIRYGTVVPPCPPLPFFPGSNGTGSLTTEPPAPPVGVPCQPGQHQQQADSSGEWIALSTTSATALMESENPEDTQYIFMFNPPLEARYVDVFPQNWRFHSIMRFALRGCHSGGHPYSFHYHNPDVCAAAKKPAARESNKVAEATTQGLSAPNSLASRLLDQPRAQIVQRRHLPLSQNATVGLFSTGMPSAFRRGG